MLLQSRRFCTLAVSFLLSLLSELRQTRRATRKLAGVAPRGPVTMFQQSRDQFSAVILMQCCCSRVSSVLWRSVPSSLSSASRYSSQTCRRNELLRAPNMLAYHKHARPPASTPASPSNTWHQNARSLNATVCKKNTADLQLGTRGCLQGCSRSNTKNRGNQSHIKKEGWLDVE